MIRFGVAGFDYKDWQGTVYPAHESKRFDRLEYLSRYFDVVEINSSFYGPPKATTAMSWLERIKAHARFRFTLKLWQRFTHQRTTAWTEQELDDVKAGFDPIAAEGRLGAVLIQFPWSFKRTEENEEWVNDLSSALRMFPLVVEVRHSSWMTGEVLSALLGQGVGIVNVDQPMFKNSLAPQTLVTAPTGYVRLHGRNYKDWFRAEAGRDERYDYLYTPDELRSWADRIKEINSNPRTKDTYVVTNNHHLGKAPANALMLEAMVEEHQVRCPEPLWETYRETLRPFVSVDPS